jgi:cytochrome c-type biogenesis protein CcmH/NrfF
VLIFAGNANPAQAQTAASRSSRRAQRDDEQIASQMYCDAGEGVRRRVRECGVQPVARGDRAAVGEGRTDDEIIDYFVERYATMYRPSRDKA